jgi:hypothetical protein
MTSDDQEQQPHSGGPEQQQQEALYGPPGRADHTPGEVITFTSIDTGSRELTGKILYIRAPGPAIVGGRSHPTTYIVFVSGESFPRVVYPGDVIERNDGSRHKQ